jgi:hypothetical protein
MEADMLKMTVIIAMTALLSFGAGIWAGTGVRATGAPSPAVTTISPSELHLRIKPGDLEVQHVDNYN